ncbi:MAG: hypothetical protein JWO52_761 [Gammaproteobacteria bacterium]|jgi:hypothetical protein|nr:hypothetical protein [Gammaproteobacteria bacterium]
MIAFSMVVRHEVANRVLERSRSEEATVCYSEDQPDYAIAQAI